MKRFKPKDPVWDFYDVFEDGSKKTVTCKDCKTVVSGKSDCLRAHTAKCNGPIECSTPSQSDQGDPGPSTPTTSRKRNLSELYESLQSAKYGYTDVPPGSPSTPKRPKIRQRNLSGFTVYTDSATKATLDEQIAKLFYSCNLPFNIADNPVWKETVEMLRPGYYSPNRKDIGGYLLNNMHEQLTSTMKQELESKNVVLMQDGWSDVHNSLVIATTLHTEGKSFFVSAVETGTNKKTAAYCTSLANEAIEQAQNTYKCTVTGVVTDNEKKMEVMRDNLKEADPNLVVYGCSAHWLNLLGQDITPVQVMNQVVEVNKYFRNHHIPGSLLSETQGSVKPQLPAETRWNSNLTCIESFLRNRLFLLLIAAQKEDLIDMHIRNLIRNVGLFNEVKHLKDQLEPIGIALDSLQSDSSTIAEACEMWLDLLSNEVLHPYEKKLKKRFDQAMTAAHFLANILHPVYQGKKLSSKHCEIAQEMLLEYDPTLVSELLALMSKAVKLPKALTHETITENTKPAIWWKSVDQQKVV